MKMASQHNLLIDSWKKWRQWILLGNILTAILYSCLISLWSKRKGMQIKAISEWKWLAKHTGKIHANHISDNVHQISFLKLNDQGRNHSKINFLVRIYFSAGQHVQWTNMIYMSSARCFYIIYDTGCWIFLYGRVSEGYTLEQSLDLQS